MVHFAAHHPVFEGKPMTGEMAAYGIAAVGAWLICYLLIERLQNRRIARRLSRDQVRATRRHCRRRRLEPARLQHAELARQRQFACIR
jgi:hypothetical protein